MRKIAVILTLALLFCSLSSGIEAAKKKPSNKAQTLNIVSPIKKKPRNSKVAKLEERVSALEQLIIVLLASGSAQQEEEGETPKETEQMSEGVSHMYA